MKMEKIKSEKMWGRFIWACHVLPFFKRKTSLRPLFFKISFMKNQKGTMKNNQGKRKLIRI
jgi:hypothetical protein